MSLLRAAPLRIARSMPVARQQVRFAHVENVVDQYVKSDPIGSRSPSSPPPVQWTESQECMDDK